MVSDHVPPAAVTPAAGFDAVYGSGAASRIAQANVLVVGAGGVGCELVKNLACTGFGRISLIDLDTIDVSNLNRQFLFRKRHVGKSKATEAAASVVKMVPGTKVDPLVGNIKETRFGVSFFKQFTLVCNALDNLEARRHVNRMCLAARVPLIESGSTGYQGQVNVINNDVECYDCTTRVPPKSYAVCTIRSTPDKPVHCVVWAKYLFDLIFGPDDDSNVLKDLDTEESHHTNSNTGLANGANNGPNHDQPNNNHSDNNPTAENAPSSKPQLKRVRYTKGEKSVDFAFRVCQRVYVDDIQSQIAMTDLWKDRAPPVVYDVNKAADDTTEDVQSIDLLSPTTWSKERSAAVFKAILLRIAEKRNEEIGKLTFDKDDPDALAFVTAASNLRSHAYSVPLQSPFAVKGIAGNIIHAIATTNAVVGGLVVLEALKVVVSEGKVHDNKNTFVSRAPTGSRSKRILLPEPLRPPNKECYVCSKGQLNLSIDVQKTTLKVLVSGVLQKELSIVQPSVHVTTGDYHNTVYESGAGLDEDEVELYNSNCEKTLQELRIEDGSQLVVEDFAQNFSCTLHVVNAKGLFADKAETEQFSLDGKVPGKEENGVSEEKKNEDDVLVDVDDDVTEVPITSTEESVTRKESAGEKDSKKRSLEEAVNGCESAERDVKRVRAESDGTKTA